MTIRKKNIHDYIAYPVRIVARSPFRSTNDLDESIEHAVKIQREKLAKQNPLSYSAASPIHTNSFPPSPISNNKEDSPYSYYFKTARPLTAVPASANTGGARRNLYSSQSLRGK